jgi:hypothetical protein
MRAPLMADERNSMRNPEDTESAPETKTASRRRGMRLTVGVSAGAVVAAAAAAALVATSASTPGKSPAQAAPAAETAGNPILTKLVADITPLRAKAGDATLEIRNQSPTGKALGDHGIGLYLDDGTYFWGNDKKALRRAVIQKTGADGEFRTYVAVALYAAKGDLKTARAKMAGPLTTPAAERTKTEKLKAVAKAHGKKYVAPKPLTPAQQKQIFDNHLWTNATSALIAAPENPQVRAGVLRILATMPKVKVTKTTTAGQPTLKLVDSWSVTGKIVETLTINARTGQPVSSTSKGSGMSSSTEYYHNSRVTLAAVQAGKF